ncbi:hypothetical protein BSU04_20550 [Caballeronia sordidicola]|uniref:Uncharacterized protein n=1 Tax=Caballeronia sordidicola TaxID=196367 RepID=A0A226WZS3_CABSO|nr:hypothetical protein BSU04_20550 [Caballeronia sordidicola]
MNDLSSLVAPTYLVECLVADYRADNIGDLISQQRPLSEQRFS